MGGVTTPSPADFGGAFLAFAAAFSKLSQEVDMPTEETRAAYAELDRARRELRSIIRALGISKERMARLGDIL